MHFPPHLFGLLHRKLIFVDDYAYADMDLRQDLDLPLPPGEQWTDVGKTYFYFVFFKVL